MNIFLNHRITGNLTLKQHEDVGLIQAGLRYAINLRDGKTITGIFFVTPSKNNYKQLNIKRIFILFIDISLTFEQILVSCIYRHRVFGRLEAWIVVHERTAARQSVVQQ